MSLMPLGRRVAPSRRDGIRTCFSRSRPVFSTREVRRRSIREMCSDPPIRRPHVRAAVRGGYGLFYVPNNTSNYRLDGCSLATEMISRSTTIRTLRLS
jgi:hypothetical protein